MNALDIIHLVTGVMAVAAGLLALWRLAAGPSLLDRTIANDVLTASGIALVGIMIVAGAREDLSVLLVILALTTFINAVVISRFAVREGADVARILTQEEADLQRAQREQEAREAVLAEVEAAAREAVLAQTGTADDTTPDGGSVTSAGKETNS